MIIFQSEVGPDVMMFDKVAHAMMELMGKEKNTRGVVTPEQMPAAIARLKAAAEEDKALHRGEDKDGDGEEESAPRVGLAQRALPLIELLEYSLARQKPVLWGV